VGAGKGPAGNHFIVLGNDVLDGEVQIGIAGDEEEELALVGFGAHGGTRNIGAVQRVAGGDDFAYNLKLPFVPYFFIEAPNDGFVIGWHVVPPLPDEILRYHRRWDLASRSHRLRKQEG
jgi:hypothetical protein